MDANELTAREINAISEQTSVAEERKRYGNLDKGFRDLRVWQVGMELVEGCYKISRSFQREERFSFTDQFRRAAISITSNIAEGWGRNTRPEFARFVDIAIGSLCELESLIEVGMRLSYLNADAHQGLLNLAKQQGAMLYRLSRSLRQ